MKDMIDNGNLLDKDLELRDLLFNRAMVKPPSELEERILRACQHRVTKPNISLCPWKASILNICLN